MVPRELAKKHASNVNDEESALSAKRSTSSSTEAQEKSDGKQDKQIVRNTSVFTWRNLTYTVKTPTGDRILLDNVHGYVKPGMLGALMGSSGAGKTTCKTPVDFAILLHWFPSMGPEAADFCY